MSKSEFIETYGEVLYESFKAFMRGQTVRVLDNGEIYYYKHDIENFFRANEDRFFD